MTKKTFRSCGCPACSSRRRMNYYNKQKEEEKNNKEVGTILSKMWKGKKENKE